MLPARRYIQASPRTPIEHLTKPPKRRLPSKKLLIVGIVAGSAAIAVGTLLFARIFYVGVIHKTWDLHTNVVSRENYTVTTSYYTKRGTGIAWPYWVVPIVIGILVVAVLRRLYIYCYREVKQGQVFRVYTSVGTSFEYSPLYPGHMRPYDYTVFHVVLYGYTRAGEMRAYDNKVSWGTYLDARPGKYMKL